MSAYFREMRDGGLAKVVRVGRYIYTLEHVRDHEQYRICMISVYLPSAEAEGVVWYMHKEHTELDTESLDDAMPELSMVVYDTGLYDCTSDVSRSVACGTCAGDLVALFDVLANAYQDACETLGLTEPVDRSTLQ